MSEVSSNGESGSAKPITAYDDNFCFVRALNNQMPREQRFIEDPIATRLLPVRLRLLLMLIRLGGLERYVSLRIDQQLPGGGIYGAVRSKMIDEMMEVRLRRRYDQVVILNARLQTRSCRNIYPAGMRVFEVDTAKAQSEKIRRLKKALGTLPEHLSFAACDIASEDIVPALERAGFDTEARTIFLWEGGSYDLLPEQAERVLGSIHSGTVPGSVLIWDYMDGRIVYDETTIPGSDAVKEYFRSMDREPQFGVRPGKEVSYLKRRGFRHRRTYGPADFTLWLDTHPMFRALSVPQMWYITECIVE